LSYSNHHALITAIGHRQPSSFDSHRIPLSVPNMRNAGAIAKRLMAADLGQQLETHENWLLSCASGSCGDVDILATGLIHMATVSCNRFIPMTGLAVHAQLNLCNWKPSGPGSSSCVGWALKLHQALRGHGKSLLGPSFSAVLLWRNGVRQMASGLFGWQSKMIKFAVFAVKNVLSRVVSEQNTKIRGSLTQIWPHAS
jgi:hypothetical protein